MSAALTRHLLGRVRLSARHELDASLEVVVRPELGATLALVLHLRGRAWARCSLSDTTARRFAELLTRGAERVAESASAPTTLEPTR